MGFRFAEASRAAADRVFGPIRPGPRLRAAKALALAPVTEPVLARYRPLLGRDEPEPLA